MSAETIILKRDQLGRVRMPAERREALLAEFERSGLPATKFAELAGVRYPTFATWLQRSRRRLKPGRGGRSPRRPRLVEAVVACGPKAGVEAQPLEIELPGEARLRLYEARQVGLVARLIRALQGLPC